jgi:hypothetical protein
VDECSGSVKFDLRKSDPQEGTSWRTEFKLLPDSANGGVALRKGTSVAGYGPGQAGAAVGSEVWAGWSIYVPADFKFDVAGEPETVAQAWSGCSNGRSPPWEIQIDQGTFEVFSRFQADGANKSLMVGTAPLTKGAWHKFVWHIKWAKDNTGLLEVWMNGTKIVNRHDVPTIWSDCTTVSRFKFGIYKWSWNSPTSSVVTNRVLYFDSIRFTDGAHGSYSVVAPR